jgi:hypothetical protein
MSAVIIGNRCAETRGSPDRLLKYPVAVAFGSPLNNPNPEQPWNPHF